eukprot:COSAG05_NODE_631_length_8203_cov_23.575148_8_plen_81_part_00
MYNIHRFMQCAPIFIMSFSSKAHGSTQYIQRERERDTDLGADVLQLHPALVCWAWNHMARPQVRVASSLPVATGAFEDHP